MDQKPWFSRYGDVVVTTEWLVHIFFNSPAIMVQFYHGFDIASDFLAAPISLKQPDPLIASYC